MRRSMPSILAGICLWSFAATAEAQGAADPNVHVMWTGLSRGSEAEATRESELRALLRKYDVEPWILTRQIIIDERALPHSHPVLTVHTRNLGNELALLATFVHEQLHWLEEAPWLVDFRAAMEELEELFPDIPSAAAGGAADERSTYRHLLVCDLEFQAMTALVGESAARRTLEEFDHYEWIYDTVLSDSRVREVVLRHGFDVSTGVPAR